MVCKSNESGTPAQYIPQLARAPPVWTSVYSTGGGSSSYRSTAGKMGRKRLHC